MFPGSRGLSRRGKNAFGGCNPGQTRNGKRRLIPRRSPSLQIVSKSKPVTVLLNFEIPTKVEY